MLADETQIAELKHAYQVLGVPLSAPPRSIKAAYRQLVKRWHPDLSAAEGGAQSESTQMTEMINDAYFKIKDAPLQGHSNVIGSATTYEPTRIRVPSSPEVTAPAPRKRDWVGFWVRFVCGALLGVVVSFRVMLSFYTRASDGEPNHVTLDLAMAATILGCAFASGLGGDRFWRSIRPWYWWYR